MSVNYVFGAILLALKTNHRNSLRESTTNYFHQDLDDIGCKQAANNFQLFKNVLCTDCNILTETIHNWLQLDRLLMMNQTAMSLGIATKNNVVTNKRAPQNERRSFRSGHALID